MLKLQQIEQPNYQIAAAAKIHPTTLSQYARGTKPISASHLIALCRLFECDAEDLLGNVEVEVTG
jgi:transcriptional regulator with XRE-family HTH domain